ncbi:thiamine pyrophosphate-dependent enzyme, possible carboligase or decarboxylase [Mycolicibacterium chubuense NBB4]|uniref:acetolactate synthase n=1 Tax=Mycolicibacterium chubuense (strain NBB4) TaxID=710421 RepID=I4BET1_MYCCN|nr:thiamine pyrophosphate-dependent enzyme [Mycolicibacterium chubuense]AFM15788.1 thiamine pyrophosphate-dependent enzyme, possible carboligase or decarboxylase [Mycolicibacterium chubuense NBB4]
MVNGRRVVDHIVGVLAARGVRHVFGVDGANIEDLYDAAYFRDDITAVLAKHEFSAAAMADGYSRSGAALGVVAATSGGGCLNTVPGLGESLASRVPVLALIGQPPTASDGRGSFQDTSGCGGALDAAALFSTVSLYCRRVVRAADVAGAIRDALAAAARGGPAVLLLPKDVQQAQLDSADPAEHHLAESGPTAVSFDLRRLADGLRGAAGRVTVIAGEQVARDDARTELAMLADALGAPVATVPDAKDVAGPSAPVTGVMGHPGVAESVGRGAACLLVGTRLPVTARAGLDDALAAVPLFSIGSAPPYLPCVHVSAPDLRIALPALARAVCGVPGRHAEALPHSRLQPRPHLGPGVRYRDAMAAIDTALPGDADIVVDAGNIGAAAIHQLPARGDGRFLVALGMGGMGYSFGAGIGTAFHRARRTVVIAGDGAFYMHGMEIHTAVQYRLPITFLLFDNHAHAMCVTREQLFYGNHYSYNRFGPSRLSAGLAAMFPGLPAVDVADVDALPAALRTALNRDGPSVVAVDCSPDEMPPFAPFLTQEDSHDTLSTR